MHTQRQVRMLLCFVLIHGLFVGQHIADALAGEFLYALHDTPTGNRLYGFGVDAVTGQLTALAGFPLPTGTAGDGAEATDRLAYDAHNQRLFALNNNTTADTIAVFQVNASSGALQPLSFSPLQLPSRGWSCLAIHPSGSPLVVGDATNRRLASFTITGNTAVAAAGSPYSTGLAGPFSCAFSRNGKYVYTGGAAGTRMAGFRVNTTSGVLAPLSGSPFNLGANAVFPLAYASDTAGRLFSAAYDGRVRVFTTTNGVPQGVANNPFAAGLQAPAHGLLHPAGFYMVADARDVFTAGAVGVYRIQGSGTNTRLTAVNGSPFPTGTIGTYVLALNPTGAFLFAANALTLDITTFAVDVSSGALLARARTAAGNPEETEPHRLTGMVYAAAPPPPASTKGYVYALRDSTGGNSLYGFAVDASTGVLRGLRGFPLPTGGRGDRAGRLAPERLAYDTVHRRLYAINTGSDTVSAYAVNRATGELEPLLYSPIALPNPSTRRALWRCVGVHPSGSPVLVGSSVLNSLASFTVTATTATPAPGSPYATGTDGVMSCPFSRDGLYFYASSNRAHTAGFTVAPTTGQLTALPGSPFAMGITNGLVPSAAYVTDDVGRVFTAASDLAGTGKLRVFTTRNGIPQAVTGNPFRSGLASPSHGVLHPDGFYIVADALNLNRLASVVGVYTISGTGAKTTLTPGRGSPFLSGGDLTNALALDQDGVFLFVAHAMSNNVATFVVSTTGKALRGQSIQPIGTLGVPGTSQNGIAIAGLVFVAR